MKFAFKTPTGIHFASRNIKPIAVLEIEGINHYVFDKNIYISEGEVKYKNPKLSDYIKEYCSVFAEFDGRLMNLRSFTNEPIEKIKQFLTNNIAQIKIWAKEYTKIYANVEQYNKSCLKKIAENKQRREKEKEASEERDRQRKSAILAESIKAESDYYNGAMISWDSFETICGRYGVNIPSRTLGSARKGIIQVNKYRHVKFKGKISPNFLSLYIEELNKELGLS